MRLNCTGKFLFTAIICAHFTAVAPLYASSHSPRLEFGRTELGRIPASVHTKIAQKVAEGYSKMTPMLEAQIRADPQVAKDDGERMVGLAGREIIVMVDRSGSMKAADANPSALASTAGWRRWDSARVATESIMELALSLDSDAAVDVILWDSDTKGALRLVQKVVTDASELAPLFRKYRPSGGTPLAQALESLYKNKLQELLKNDEPFTCIIMTDGGPDDKQGVKDFFKKVIKDNRLEESGRETLAGFSLVRMGDEQEAIDFLEELDDKLIAELGVRVDIVDTKEDNFLFGTGAYKNKAGIGPFALLWDALYD